MRKGLLLGAAILLLVLPPVLREAPAPRPAPIAAVAPATPPAAVAPPSLPSPPTATVAPPSPPATVPRPSAPPVVRRAEFAGKKPTSDVRQLADWVVTSRDHQRMGFVIVDKKDAKVYVFDPQGRLKSVAPALLGQARADHTVPGIGDKPVAEVLPEERTTPAGRFIAEIGMSSSRGEDVVWVDYDAAVSMHRVLDKKERRVALASPTNADNRMSYGCINLPRAFYEKVLWPTVTGPGAVIYVLPEKLPMREVFASFYDVTAPLKVAQP